MAAAAVAAKAGGAVMAGKKDDGPTVSRPSLRGTGKGRPWRTRAAGAFGSSLTALVLFGLPASFPCVSFHCPASLVGRRLRQRRRLLQPSAMPLAAAASMIHPCRRIGL